MIIGHEVGDILSVDNPRDVIIGMNPEFREVNGIGKPFVNARKLTHPLDLGAVLSFKLDERRNLHMLICHRIGEGGWKQAEQHIRYGLDFLNQNSEPGRNYSIVEIGTGAMGRRYGADPGEINRGIADSHLRVTQFIYRAKELVAESAVMMFPPLLAYRAIDSEGIVQDLRRAA